MKVSQPERPCKWKEHTIWYGKWGRQKTIQLGMAKGGGRRPYNLVWQRGEVEDHTIRYGKGGEVEDHTIRYGKGGRQKTIQFGMAKGGGRRPYNLVWQRGGGRRPYNQVWQRWEAKDHTLRYGKGNSLEYHTQSMAKGSLKDHAQCMAKGTQVFKAQM